MHVPAAAAAGAGVTAGTGAWLFSYNKENFGNDVGQRFGRFMSARGFANTQVGQYREDVVGLTEMTVAKMDTWSMVCTCFLAICTALSCAGRIGMHGAAPPNWYCSLYSCNIFAAVLFIGLSLWLSMHASLRAQCAAASLLTRKVRLPIPSMGQIDQARVFGSAFEKQEWRDIFRVPFMPHPEEVPELPDAEDDDEDAKTADGKKKKTVKHFFQYQSPDPHKGFATTTRGTIPTWVRDEVVTDKGGPMDSTQATSSELEGEPDMFEFEGTSEPPTHFAMIAKAQEEWRDYDVYARISMLYGVVSFLYAVCYYAIGYSICELRGFWVMWSVPMVFMTAQGLILRLDVLKTGSHHMLPNAEILGHLAPYWAVVACTLEYRAYWSWASYITTWAFVMLAFFSHLIMAVRMLDLAWPSHSAGGDMPDEPGKHWWPNSWKVPQSYSKALWFIAPPKKLEPGQHDLMHEMGQLRSRTGGITTCRRRRAKQTDGEAAAKAMGKEETEGMPYTGKSPFSDFGTKRVFDLPWHLARTAICAVILMWFSQMVFTMVEIIMGPETLLKPPGEPPWIRDTKYRSWGPEIIHLSSQSALPDDYRLFSASDAYYKPGDQAAAADHGAEGGAHRRLAAMKRAGLEAAMGDLAKVMPEIGWLADAIEKGQHTQTLAAPVMESAVPSQGFMTQPAPIHHVEWPVLFEPKHLVCSPSSIGAGAKVAALTPRGFGALVQVGNDEATPFALEGLGEWGPLAGAGWGHRGLQLVTKHGHLFYCPGHDIGELGSWKCQKHTAAPVPMPAGAKLFAAAVQEFENEHRVAVIFEHFPKMVALFRHVAGEWIPHGEVHVPMDVNPTRLGLAFHDEHLLMTTPAGEVHMKHLRDGSVFMHPATADAQREFHSACHLPNGNLMRLALRQKLASLGSAWGAELIGTA
mmetsp:Transcript_14913/g.38295  ORF Transcript_14913/g.38295 Transcript_14913/m.38295 type:complete len:919 (-) Transcript_14913:78-2834(-)